MSVPPVTDVFARFIAEASYSSISNQALVNAKMHILDTLGAALAAVPTDTAAIALEYCRRVGQSNKAATWGKSSSPARRDSFNDASVEFQIADGLKTWRLTAGSKTPTPHTRGIQPPHSPMG